MSDHYDPKVNDYANKRQELDELIASGDEGAAEAIVRFYSAEQPFRKEDGTLGEHVIHSLQDDAERRYWGQKWGDA